MLSCTQKILPKEQWKIINSLLLIDLFVTLVDRQKNDKMISCVPLLAQRTAPRQATRSTKTALIVARERESFHQ